MDTPLLFKVGPVAMPRSSPGRSVLECSDDDSDEWDNTRKACFDQLFSTQHGANFGGVQGANCQDLRPSVTGSKIEDSLTAKRTLSDTDAKSEQKKFHRTQ
jgi:hypothetical protein